MPPALAEQLAKQLDIDTEAAERLVTNLVGEIKEQLAETGEASLPGLGTFQTGDGPDDLSFVPDAALADAVNHRFVGLEPVDVDVDEDVSEYAKNEIFRSEEPEETPSETTPPAPPEPGEAAEKETTAATPEPDAEPDATEPDEASPRETPAEEVEKEATGSAAEERGAELAAAAQGQSMQREQASPDPEGEEPGAAPPVPDRSPHRDRSSRRRTATDDEGGFSVVTWLIVLLVLAVMGAGLWYLYSESRSSSPEPAAAQQDGLAAPASPENGSESGETAGEDESAASEEEAAAPTYTLPGGLDVEQGGYSIVIASETEREAAETTLRRYAEALRGEDLAFGIVSAEVEGTERFRVAVGQFESSSEARSTIQRLGERLPDGAWVYNLGSDS